MVRTTAVVFVLSAVSGIVLYTQWWLPNIRLRDENWLIQASLPEQLAVIHKVMWLPRGNHHDAFIIAGRIGSPKSVPYLITGLRWQPDNGAENTTMGCTKRHCLEALRSITGHDAGLNHADWARWWDSVGQRVPSKPVE